MGRMTGRVAVVTGAGRGLGRAEALALADAGATVVVNDPGFRLAGVGRDEAVALGVVTEIERAGGTAVGNFADCSDWQEAQDLIESTVERFGRLDVLVNNAGIVRDKMSFNLEPEDWDSVIRVNLTGHFAPIRYAAAFWRKQAKAGVAVDARIVNTTSEAGLHGNTGQLNYTSAKSAIATMTVALARELAPYGVKVNAVSPRASTRLSMFIRTGDDQNDYKLDDSFWNPKDPANIGPVVVWLASNADFTGQIIWALGGQIGLYRQWHKVSEISKEGQWTVDELVAASEELFTGQSKDPEPFPFETQGQAKVRAAKQSAGSSA